MKDEDLGWQTSPVKIIRSNDCLSCKEDTLLTISSNLPWQSDDINI